MITDAQTLTEALGVLNASIESAVAQFENSVGYGAIVKLYPPSIGKSYIIPDDVVWSASSSAHIVTNEINTTITL